MIQNKASLIYSLENFINNLEEIVKQSVSVNTHNSKVVSSSLTPATNEMPRVARDCGLLFF